MELRLGEPSGKVKEREERGKRETAENKEYQQSLDFVLVCCTDSLELGKTMQVKERGKRERGGLIPFCVLLNCARLLA